MNARPLLTAAFTLLFVACQQPIPDRSTRLLGMAGEEAAAISNTLDRFTRQLHVADTQLTTGQPAAAAKTLYLARETLKSGKKEEFDDFHRIAAWTAVSQLARTANDRTLALESSDAALAALNDVQPADARAQYVQSLAFELAELRGTPSAIELLASGGAWAAEIRDVGIRRSALIAFADQLVSYDAYDQARAMLRRDPDAAWRADAFVALANEYRYGNSLTMIAGGRGRGGGAGGAGGTPQWAAEVSADRAVNLRNGRNTFGKDVRYENVFKK